MVEILQAVSTLVFVSFAALSHKLWILVLHSIPLLWNGSDNVFLIPSPDGVALDTMVFWTW